MKQIYEMVILGSGGDVGRTVQTYCVSKKVGDQANQILVVRARRIFSHHSLY